MSIKRPIGISIRRQWLDHWSSMGLDRFDFYEIVPFNTFGLDEAEEVERILKLTKGKPAWLHLTSVSLGDDHDFFVRRLSDLDKVLGQPGIAGVSLHFASEYSDRAVLPAPSAILKCEEISDRCAQNLAHLKQLVANVAIENLSTTLDEVAFNGYSSFFREFLAANNVPALLDLTNLFNSSANSGIPMAKLLGEMNSIPIAYTHFGGSLLFDGLWLDSHSDFPEAFDTQWLAAVPANIPLVFEYDWQSWDIPACTKVIERALNV